MKELKKIIDFQSENHLEIETFVLSLKNDSIYRKGSSAITEFWA